MRRPRIRSADDTRELPVETYEYFADRDALTRAVMDRMLAGVSTRRFAAVGEPVGSEVEAESRSTSKTSESEMFVERTATALEELMGRRLDDVRLGVRSAISMPSSIITAGRRSQTLRSLWRWQRCTSATLARTLLADLVERGLDPEQAILFVIDGSKALRRAIRDVFGEHASATATRSAPGCAPHGRSPTPIRARRVSARASCSRWRNRIGRRPPRSGRRTQSS